MAKGTSAQTIADYTKGEGEAEGGGVYPNSLRGCLATLTICAFIHSFSARCHRHFIMFIISCWSVNSNRRLSEGEADIQSERGEGGKTNRSQLKTVMYCTYFFSTFHLFYFYLIFYIFSFFLFVQLLFISFPSCQLATVKISIYNIDISAGLKI